MRLLSLSLLMALLGLVWGVQLHGSLTMREGETVSVGVVATLSVGEVGLIISIDLSE